MKKCLTDLIYADVQEKLNVGPEPFDENKRWLGLDWPAHAHTMIGIKRLDNIQSCVEDVLNAGTPGDLIETGCGEAGSDLHEGYPQSIRCEGLVWVADPHHRFKELVVPLDRVQSNFAKYDLLDEQVQLFTMVVPRYFAEGTY